IPSKALVEQAELMRSIPELEKLGIKVDLSGLNYEKAYEESRKAAAALSKGVSYLLKKNGVAVVKGTAVFNTANELVVDNNQVIKAKSIIIATGSSPKEIPVFKFDNKLILSSTDILFLKELPKSILILGAGAIGVEFAHILNAFGVEVYLVEMMDRILPVEDHEVSEQLLRSFKKRKLNVYTSTKITGVTKGENSIDVEMESVNGTQSLTVDKMLVVAGRTPNTSGIGLEKIGVKTERGFVVVNDNCETSVSGVYAIGDIVNTPLLAHVASKEGEIAAEHIAGLEPKKLNRKCIPAAVYCEPQVASFGLTESEAKEKGLEYKVSKFPYKGIGKAVAVGKSEGFVKLITNSSGTILGGHIFGSEASDLIHEMMLGTCAGFTPMVIAEMIHAHPTLSEGIMEAARLSLNKAIHI
ncbi:MAG: dihydrolipoyl dehydrogenase, partial [Fibrobacter sp.]|nr:dihydrolipoyl dehydrogenase [Fibrobacter sp.]